MEIQLDATDLILAWYVVVSLGILAATWVVGSRNGSR